MSDPDKLPPRYPDEVWLVSVDWTTALEGDAVVGTPTAIAMPDVFTVEQITQNGAETSFRVLGGEGRRVDARIALLATTSNGEKLGWTLGAPIRAR